MGAVDDRLDVGGLLPDPGYGRWCSDAGEVSEDRATLLDNGVTGDGVSNLILLVDIVLRSKSCRDGRTGGNAGGCERGDFGTDRGTDERSFRVCCTGLTSLMVSSGVN